MERHELKVFFSINYQTSFGENLFVIGEVPVLGKWDPAKAYPLNYHSDGEWSGMVKFPADNPLIQYKYLVLDSAKKKVIWEEGDNRYLELSKIKANKGELFLKETWNHREVNIRINYDCPKNKVLAICGEGAMLGGWKTPMHMTLVQKKDPQQEGKKAAYWQRSFFVRQDCKRLNYRFVIWDTNTCEYFWEREPDRVCNFVTLQTISPYKSYHAHPNQKDSIKFVRNHNRFIKYDVNFVAEFQFNEINENIIIGPYPQNGSEIEYLRKSQVKALLNLQTKNDMRHRSIDWVEHKEYCKQNDIKGVNFPILDMNQDDMAAKAFDAATLLHELISKFNVNIINFSHSGREYMSIVQLELAEPLIQLRLILFFIKIITLTMQ